MKELNIIIMSNKDDDIVSLLWTNNRIIINADNEVNELSTTPKTVHRQIDIAKNYLINHGFVEVNQKELQYF